MLMSSILLTTFFSLAAMTERSSPAGKFELLKADGEFVEKFELRIDGTVTGETSSLAGQRCSGSYTLSDDGLLTITYDGLQGPGTGGGCHNASSRIELGGTRLEALQVGDVTDVVSRSIMNYSATRHLLLKRVQ